MGKGWSMSQMSRAGLRATVFVRRVRRASWHVRVRAARRISRTPLGRPTTTPKAHATIRYSSQLGRC